MLTVDVHSGNGDKGYYRGILELGYDTSFVPVYTGVHHPGTAANYFRLGWDPDSFAVECNVLTGQQTPLSSVRTYVQDGQRLWSGVFTGTTNNVMLRWYLTWEGFMQLWGENYGSMCLTDLETFVENGERRWAGIWENSTDSNGFAFGYSGTDLQAQADEWGIPLVRMKTYMEYGQRIWFGIYRDTGVGTKFSYDLTFDEFLSLLGSNNGKKKLTGIETYNAGGQQLWACIWEDTPSDNVVSF